MIRRLLGPLPNWAEREHPVLRYELGRTRPSARLRWLTLLGGLLLVALLLAMGYLLATRNLTQPPGQSLTESGHNVVYWPTLALQVAAGILAVALTARSVGEALRDQQWDSLRVTAAGVELALRARWMAVFFRLRWLLAAIVAVRALLVLGILYDLTSFQGRYLDFLLNGIQPELSLAAGVVLLALLMTAALILPLTSVGLDGAFGLLLSTIFRQPVYLALVQVFFALLRLGVLATLAQAMTQYTLGLTMLERPVATALVVGHPALADGGLAYLNLNLFGNLWPRVPGAVLMSAGLLVIVLLQALLADRLVALAVRRAERRG